MGQRWAQLLSTAADTLEGGSVTGALGKAGPWSCDMMVPKKVEAQWSMHGMGFGITRRELGMLFASTGRHTAAELNAVWETFHAGQRNSSSARANNGQGKGKGGNGHSKPANTASETAVVDAVGLIVTYYLLCSASVGAKVSAVFNFMDFNNRTWISGSELAILFMSLAYTLEDVWKNAVRARQGFIGNGNSNGDATTAHDESDEFLQVLLGGKRSGVETLPDGDFKVDYATFFDNMQRVLAEQRKFTTRPGLAELCRLLDALDPSNEEDQVGEWGGCRRWCWRWCCCWPSCWRSCLCCGWCCGGAEADGGAGVGVLTTAAVVLRPHNHHHPRLPPTMLCTKGRD
jgi:hypothetical protein